MRCNGLPATLGILSNMKLSSIIAARHRIYPSQDLLFTVDSSINYQTFIYLNTNLNYSGVIDWGDGSSNTVLSGTGNTQAAHNFSTVNTFQVKVSGTQVPSFKILSSTQYNVVSVENLGNIGLQDTSTMFKGSVNLTSANLGDYITSIGDEIFKDCTSLTSVTIGVNTTSIGNHPFNGCTALATVNCSTNKSVIDSSTDIFLNTASPLTINVPIGTSGWSAGTGLSIGGNTNVTVNLI